MPSDSENEVPAEDHPVMPSQSMWDANDTVIAAHYQRLRRSPVYEGFFWSGTIPLDDAARKQVFVKRMERWAESLELQHNRLTTTAHRYEGDLDLYVLAVHNLVNAAEALRREYSRVPGLSRAIKKALQKFNGLCDDVPVLRNLIEHSASYDRVLGDMQKSGELPKVRMGETETYSLLLGDARLSIFGKTMTVSSTTPAARQLTADVLALKNRLPG